MKRTFKDKIIIWYGNRVAHFSKLRFLWISIAFVHLLADSLIKRICSNGRKLSATAFTILFFTFSCSFTSAVFFEPVAVSEPADSMPIVSSNAELAKVEETAVNLQEEEDDKIALEGETNLEEDDFYSATNLLEDIAGSDMEVELFGNSSKEENDSFSRDDWQLILINKQHPIPEDYSFVLSTIKGSMKCDERILSDLVAMMQGALEDNVNLVICSPYRDLSRQEMLFQRKINQYTSKGVSYLEAYRLAAQAVTVPGASEHQVGLALDIVSNTYSTLDAGFGQTDAGKWLNDHSWEYGFILRYPDGGEYITGIEFEPWHFRYVGKKAAQVIKEENITLEEFWEKYL